MNDTEFRIEIEKLLISKNGVIADWCNNYTGNLIILEKLQKRIKKHPIIWKIFFMIA